jgi:RNA 3'-terminal phosphate cyclase-like protein
VPLLSVVDKVCKILLRLTKQVIFTCPVIKELKSIELLDGGQIKRVRGVAYTTRASPAIAPRMVDTAKGLLINYVSDVFIYVDNYRGRQTPEKY